MSTYLNYSMEWLEKHNAFHTANEICQQPKLWSDVLMLVSQDQNVKGFLKPLLADPNLDIILTGAGSSAFAGAALAPWLREYTHRNVTAYGSTEIVANPLQYLSPNKKTLLISYARSGNSPESVAAVKLADQLLPNCYHLFLTCNPNSSLTHYAKQVDQPNRICELIMPDGSHDVSFAMTSSITCMMLATLLLLGGFNNKLAEQCVSEVVDICKQKLIEWQAITKQLATKYSSRVIYVGSSCFTGLAQEAALKVLELTAGKIATRFDSSLGLRHGPKFMIDSQSLVICFLSNSAYTRNYDLDLFNELSKDAIATNIIALSGQNSNHDNALSLNTNIDDCWLMFPYLMFAQMLAFEKSLSCGLTPDNPCPTGEVNRVVKGVNIYSFKQQ